MPETAGTILVVDDSPKIRRMLRQILSAVGFAVQEAATGAEGLRLVREGADLVIVDVRLPDLDGFEVCRRIKADPRTASVAVLHLSGVYRRVEDRVRGLEGGADGYLMKPFHPDELVAMVRALLRARRAEVDLQASEVRRRTAEALTEVGRVIAQSLDPEDVSRRIVESLRKLLGVQTAGLFRLEPASGDMVGVAVAGDIGPRFPGRVVFPRGTGLIAVAVAARRLVLTANVLTDERVRLTAELRAAIEHAPYRAGAALPLVVTDQVIGGLIVADREGRVLDADGIRLMETFGDQAVVALENARLYEEAERRRREAEVISELARNLNASLDLDTVLQRVVEGAKELCGSDLALIALREAGSPAMAFHYWTGVRSHAYGTRRIEPGTGAGGAAMVTGQPVRTASRGEEAGMSPDDDPVAREEGAVAGMIVPIRSEGRVGGLVYVYNRAPRPFTDRDESILQRLAEHAAIAIQNAQRLQELSRTQHQLLHAQKMEAVGRLAGGIAHDFNNLLTVIYGRSQLLLDRLSPEDPGRRHLELIHRTAERAASLTQQLLAFSRKQVLQPEILDLNAVIASVKELLRRLIGEHIELVIRPAAGLGRVKADRGQLEQVILNLAVNARDAMPAGGELILETANVERDESVAREHVGVESGGCVSLSVRDAGIGMDAETQAHIFEPFFTTKETGKGTGLGLAMVYGIVQQSGGAITVTSEPGHGTTFTIYLPQIDVAGEVSEPALAPTPLQGGAETILLVEDEAAVRDLTREILEGHGYQVLVTEGPAHALRTAHAYADPIHLLVSDVIMPQMSGRELADRLARLRPLMQVLFMSGYTDDAILHHGVLDPGTAFIQKPFTPEALARKVREVLDAPPGEGPMAPAHPQG